MHSLTVYISTVRLSYNLAKIFTVVLLQISLEDYNL